MSATEERPIGHDGHSPVPLIGDVHTEEEIDAFVENVRQGAGLDLAARSMGSTATRIGRFRKREPEFDARVAEAQQEAHELYQDRLRATARTKATAIEGGSDRILEVELATHVPGYEHLRRDKMRVDGKIEHAISLDAGAIDRLSTEQKEALLGILDAMGGEIIEGGEPKLLGPGE